MKSTNEQAKRYPNKKMRSKIVIVACGHCEKTFPLKECERDWRLAFSKTKKIYCSNSCVTGSLRGKKGKVGSLITAYLESLE